MLIKFGLEEISPLVFAGLCYLLAFLVLLPFLWRQSETNEGVFRVPSSVKRLTWGDWGRLVLLGMMYYAVTQGSQFVALAHAPAVTVTLILNFTVVFVALIGIFILGERPNGGQWLGIIIALAGAVVYFYPFGLEEAQWIGVVAALVTMLANAVSSVLGRYVNRANAIKPLTVTVISMGVGALIMLAAGVILEGIPTLSGQSWVVIAWLAVVHTAAAFTLWNHTLRTLPAVESAVINNTMTVQIAVLALLFLGETISGRELLGLATVVVGTLLVQIGRREGV